MSCVTNAILCWGFESEDQLARVNEFFGPERTGFISVEDPMLPEGWYGGNKRLECDIAIGAFNYLDEIGLAKHIRSLTWEAPECVQLLLRRHEADKFEELNWRDM